jgi:hypothetical protein
MAKIRKITEDQILFDDGSKIWFDHCQDCCEHNYADFEQLDDLARAHNFNTSKMLFEKSGDHGFIFGDNRRTFFVPCYSVQNGYYTTAVDIYFNGKCVLGLNGEFVDG